MKKTKQYQKVTNDFKQAAGLLRHDLVWSDDFDSIRFALADFIEAQASSGAANSKALLKVVDGLLATENDLSIGDQK